jgi:hypothetical protein
MNKSILLWKWPKNAKDDAYKTSILSYSKKLDRLVSTNYIIRIDVEEKNSWPCSKDVVINLEEETMNLKDTTPMSMP